MCPSTELQQTSTAALAPLSSRSARFRQASRARVAEAAGAAVPSATVPSAPRLPTRHVDLLHAFFERYAELPFEERYARSLAYAIESAPVYLLDDERLVGMLYQTTAPGQKRPTSPWDDAWRAYDASTQIHRAQEKEIEPYLRIGGAPGHVGWRWDWILERGIEGHLAVLREHLAQAEDDKARQLYAHAILLWESVLRWNDRHVEALQAQLAGLGEDADGAERERLETLIALCQRVPRHPARTFHEALQSFYLQHLALMFENPFGGNGPGRVDLLLGPYLERDLDVDRITLDEARELVDELLIRFHERLAHADGWVEAIMVGGVGQDGQPVANTLSRLIIESIIALDLTHPSIYVRLAGDGPEELLDLSVEYLLHGRNRAQIFNDDAVLPAMQRRGIPAEDAAMYMAGGCMEISVQGANSDLNFAGTFNVAKTLELVLTGGVDLLDGQRRIALDRDLTAFADFEALYAAFEAELAREYGEIARALDLASACYAAYRPTYLLSSLTLDCLERGREQQDGGARYHDYGFAPLGITSAADALHALDLALYRDMIVTADELLAALRANFQGHEALRVRLRSLPKYGQEDADADALCDRVMASVCDLATAQETRFGGRLKPMMFNFVWTPTASRILGARPDGSLAGDLIGHGMTPRAVAMTGGITAAMNSCLSLDYGVVSGGATTMWDMDERWITPALMKALLTAFLRGGGMIFQGNTTSVAEMEDAYRHPERYPNLIVRVGGFSARFVTLDRDVQREVMERYRHAG
jgi:trans-4-hydroxy-L-proline dehydratase